MENALPPHGAGLPLHGVDSPLHGVDSPLHGVDFPLRGVLQLLRVSPLLLELASLDALQPLEPVSLDAPPLAPASRPRALLVLFAAPLFDARAPLGAVVESLPGSRLRRSRGCQHLRYVSVSLEEEEEEEVVVVVVVVARAR